MGGYSRRKQLATQSRLRGQARIESEKMLRSEALHSGSFELHSGRKCRLQPLKLPSFPGRRESSGRNGAWIPGLRRDDGIADAVVPRRR